MPDLIERPDRLKLYRFGELVNQAPSPWLIKGVIRETSVACLFGPRGSCKSFVALSMAGSVATGVNWMGRPVLNKGLVVYVAAEGGGGMVQRARAWAEQHDMHPSGINVRFVTEPFICLPESDDMDTLVERIKDAIGWQPADHLDLETGHVYDEAVAEEWPALIVIDTLARCFIGDENKQEDMGAFIQGVDRLKMEFNCAVLVIHHSGLEVGRERGSTALGGACDTVYKLSAAEDSPTLTMDCTKMKDSKEPEPVAMYRREVQVSGRPTDDPDEDLSSLVIESELSNRIARKAHILQVLEDMQPVSWLDWLAGSGLPRSTFQSVVSELRQSGQIIKENDAFRVA